jgi:hypothetical protein
MQAFNSVIIPDPKDSSLVYIATKDGDEVKVNHRSKDPKPGYLGPAGTLTTMSTEEFKKFMIDTVPKVNLQKTPNEDTFTKSS